MLHYIVCNMLCEKYFKFLMKIFQLGKKIYPITNKPMGLILFCTSLAWIAKHINAVTNYVREHILQFSKGLQKNKCPCHPLIFAPAENKYNYLIMGSIEIKVVLYQTSERGRMLNG